ncbi:MAG: dTDP-4-dehydrorhamnose 3,5-epimerase [Candidatus Sulfotelmatobacter sp.]
MNGVEAIRTATNVLRKIPTALPGVFVLEPRVFRDERGFFFESYNQRIMAEVGIGESFVQDNHSCSSRNVLRGLHYQVKHPQGKLVRAAEGEILDVAVDLRRSSATFGRWEAVRLSGENHRMLWIPVGFAHGFRVLSEKAHVLYKATDFYAPVHERTLAWNDPQLKIDWELDGEPIVSAPIVSAKDQRGVKFHDAESFD